MLGGILVLAVMATKLCGVSRPLLLPATSAIHDQKQAVAIAYAAAVKIYGRENIDSERPLNAVRSGSVWKVEGALPPNRLGGVLEVTLATPNGAVIYMCHGK